MRCQRQMVAAVAGVLLAGVVCVSPAMADEPSGAVTSVRTFTPLTSARTSLLVESSSTTGTGDWGGIEQLNVPQVKSPAQKRAEQAAEQERQRQAEASRTARRAPLTATTASSPNVPIPTSGLGKAVVEYALQYQGAPYMYGGTTPNGWDCSGFTRYVYAHFGITLPHQSEAQRAYGTPVTASEAQPGDLMWKPGHVGIYIGNGKMIHASTPATGTLVSDTYAQFQYYRLRGEGAGL